MMRTLRLLSVLVLVAARWSTVAVARDLADLLLDGIPGPNAGSVPVDYRIYSGRIKGFANADAAAGLEDIVISGRGRSLPRFLGTRAEFRAFVAAHAAEIRQILFPSDLESSVQGVPGAAARSLDTFNAVVTPTFSPSEFAALRAEPHFAPQESAPHQPLAFLEYERFSIDGNHGNNFKVTPGYEFQSGAFQVGVLAPLRYGNVEDRLDTESFTGGLDVHAKYRFAPTSDWSVSPLVGAFGNFFTMNSDSNDSAGYVRYGGYGGVSTKLLLEPVILAGGVTYSVSDIAVPRGLFSSSLAPLADPLLDRPTDQEITVGGKVGIPLFGDVLGTVGGTHVETVGASDVTSGLRSFTQGTLSLMYFPSDQFGLEVGYRQVFGAAHLDVYSAIVDAVWNF